jgi:hypothetical protein
MKPKSPDLETVLLLLLSVALLVASPSSISLRMLNLAYSSEAWERHTDGFSQVMVLYSVALLTLAVVSYACSMRGLTLTSPITRHAKEALSILREAVIPAVQHCFVSRSDTAWLLLALVIAVAVRGYFLAQPMRYDESVTFLDFANKGLLDLFYYPYPNNHVLHTILVRASTLIWGAHPASIRLPALWAGIGLIPLIFCLCRRLGQSGVFAIIAAAVFPYLISYSTNARGYTLLVFLTLLLAFVGVEVARKPSLGGAAVVSSVAALGIMTMPTMLFPIAGLYGWLACLLLVKGHTPRSMLLGFVIPCILMTVAFTLVLYTPVILVSDGLQSIVANRFVQPQTWREFLGQLYPHVQSLGEYSRDIPWPVLLLGIALVIVGLYRSIRRRDWPTLLILPSILLGSVFVLLLQRRIPFARTWIYVVPFILLIADSGFTWIGARISHTMHALVTTAIYVGAAVAAIGLISSGAIASYPDTGSFPEARIVAGYLKPIMTSDDTVEAQVPADWPTYFYLWYYGATAHYLERDPGAGRTFLVVKKSRYSIEDMTQKPVVKLLDVGDMALYQAVDQDVR